MSTKKKIVIFISFLIVVITLAWVVSNNKNNLANREQQRLITEKKVFEERKAFAEKQKIREEEQKISEEKRILAILEKLEEKFDKDTGFWNDDETALKEIKRRIVKLQDEKWSEKYKYRIEKLIDKCEDKL